MRLKICIIGASGFYGKPIYNELCKRNDVVGTSHAGFPGKGFGKLDITDRAEVESFFRAHKPDIAINLAAITDVDLCERERELCLAVNSTGARNVALACGLVGAKLCHFSTDFVFDGAKGDYSESDAANPINNYGKAKLEAEKAVQGQSGSAIIRTSTPYGGIAGAKKFVNQAIGRLSAGLEVFAFSDFTRSPTLVEEVAENFPIILKKDFSGIINLAGSSQLSMYDAALEIASVFGFDDSMVRGSTGAQAGFCARRPPNTGLDVSLARGMGIRMRTFTKGLERLRSQGLHRVRG